MKRAWKWFKRIVLGTIAFVAFVVIVVLILLHTDFGRDKARTIALDQLQKFFPGGIHVEAITGSVLGDIELHNITINGFDKKQMIHAKKARANLKIGSIFSKTIELEYVELEDVTVVDPSNPVLVPPDDEPGTWDVTMPAIRVRRANVTISGDEPMTFQGVDIDASLGVPSDADLQASAKVTGFWKEHGLAFEVKTEAKVGELVAVPVLNARLGETTIDATGLVIDTARPIGSLKIHATPAVVTKFAPNVVLPSAADLTIDISKEGAAESRVAITGKMGTTTLTANLVGDITAQKVRGLVTADTIDLNMFVPRLTGRGDGTISIVFDGKAQTALVTAIVRGQLLDLPAGHAIISVDASENSAKAMLLAGGNGGLGTSVYGSLVRDGEKIDLVHAAVVTTVRDASLVSNGKVPFKGAITAKGTAKGSLAPDLNLALTGQVNGYGLSTTDPKMGGIAIAQVTGNATARITEAGTRSKLTATVKKLSRGGELLADSVEVVAENRLDGKIEATVVARPAAVPHMEAKIGAIVSLGKHENDPIEIELGEHSIKAPRIAWGGTGGSVRIDDKQVVIKDFKSGSGTASLSADATITSATQELEVKANLAKFPLGMLDPDMAGTVTATVDMKRRGINWNGKANVGANGVVLGPGKPAIEGNVTLTIANRRVTADINANALLVGGVRLVLDVEGPRDITDADGWKRLERTAIKTALLGVTRIDLGAPAIGVPNGGIVEGELVLGGMETSGQFTVRGVQTLAGAVEGDINFAPLGNDLGIAANVRVANFGEAQIAAQIAIPQHPFEPLEWRKLGRGVIRTLTATVENVVIDPKKLATFGVDVPLKGKVSARVLVAAGAGEAKATIDIREVVGGKLLTPIDVRIEAGTTQSDTNAKIEVRTSRPAEWADADKRLLTVNAKLPNYTFDRWIAEKATNVLVAPLQGRLEIPNIDLVETLAMIGRKDLKNGRVGGGIDITGTVGKPTASGEIVVTNVDVKPRLTSGTRTKLPTLTELKIMPKWNGTEAELTIRGKESDGAKIDITARVNPKQIDALAASIIMDKFDIAPIAVFLPGPLVAATGKISANITVQGLTPDKIRGSFKLDKGRVPVHPTVGTVRDTNLEVKLTNQGLTYKVEAKLGSGTIKLAGAAPADLTTVTFKGAVDKVSPIHEIAPVISATIDGTIFREEGLLRAEAKLSKANVNLDMEQGVKLLPGEMPDDLFLNRTSAPPPVTKQLRQPRKPWITVKVALESTPVYVKHEFFEVRARVRSPKGVTVGIGRTLHMDGSVEIERGDVDVLGRHYRVDPGPDKIRFDGTPDPLLAIRLIHDFPELTLTADITNRASKRKIHMTGSPAIYTQDELLAFFVGGDPAGGSGSTSRDVASNAGAAILSAKLSKTAKKILPIKVDVVGCDAGTATSSPACKFGRWLSENMLFVFKTRVAPRPDETPTEGQLQIYFKKSWVIEAAGTTDRFGGDILWRKRW